MDNIYTTQVHLLPQDQSPQEQHQEPGLAKCEWPSQPLPSSPSLDKAGQVGELQAIKLRGYQ